MRFLTQRSLVARAQAGWIILPAIALFWLLLFATGQPAPFSDDLGYAGAAINFATGGNLFNPYLRVTWPGLKMFNIYPPIEPYALGFWLSFWGVSTHRILAFFLACNVASSLAAWQIIKNLNLSLAYVPVAVLAIADTMLYLGFRVEAFSLVCLLVGFVFMTGRSSDAQFGVGIFFAAVGSLAAPSFVAAGFLWIVVAVFYRISAQVDAFSVLRAALIGVVGAGLMLLLAIHFDLKDFVANFVKQMKWLQSPDTPPGGPVVPRRASGGPLKIIAAVSLILGTVPVQTRLASIALLISAVSIQVRYGRGWEPHLVLCIAFIAAIESIPRQDFRTGLRCALLIWLIVLGLPWIGYGVHHFRPARDIAAEQRVRNLVSRYRDAGKTFAVDPISARNRFDFILPITTLDFPGSLVSVANGDQVPRPLTGDQKNEIWIFNTYMLERYPEVLDEAGLRNMRVAIRNKISQYDGQTSSRLFEEIPLRLTSFFGFNRYVPLEGSSTVVTVDLSARTFHIEPEIGFHGPALDGGWD